MFWSSAPGWWGSRPRRQSPAVDALLPSPSARPAGYRSTEPTTPASSTPASTTPPALSRRRSASKGRSASTSSARPHGVPHNRCGKLIVGGGGAMRRRCKRCTMRGTGNGAVGLELVDQGFIAAREPHVQAARRALWSPAIAAGFDASSLVLALRPGGQAPTGRAPRWSPAPPSAAPKSRTGSSRCRSKRNVWGARWSTPPGCTPMRSRIRSAVRPFTIYPCRGEYAEFAPASALLVKGLVYPLPARLGPRTRRAPDADAGAARS